MAMGLALFGLILMLFFIVQSFVVFREMGLRHADLFPGGFGVGDLDDPQVAPLLRSLTLNGDVVAIVSFWSGLLCTLALLTLTFLWKRKGFRDVLGIRPFTLRSLLTWAGIFIVLMALLELLAWLSPVFQAPFMESVLGSTTNMWLLILGVGVMAPVFEEFLLRGLLLGSLRYVVNEHVAVAISAGVFTVMHLQYEAPVMLLILPMGVVLGYARVRSGSIFVPILLHMMNNMASTFLN